MSALKEREAFAALVERLEKISKKDPSAYRLRLGFLGVLGYVFIFTMLLLALGLIGALVVFVVATGSINYLVIKIAFFLLIFAGIIIRSLWVRFQKPVGIQLKRAQVPELFKMIDALTSKLQAPRFNHVLLDIDFNAAVAQIPRLGLFGWYTNYLILGYPLMQALTTEQFRAVLAHELGHLSAQHGRFGIWIGRLRATWGRLIEDLEKRNTSFLFNLFLKWYGPYFMAYSFVLARANEYEADRASARLTSSRALVEGLISLQVRDKFLDKEFWEKIRLDLLDSPQPPDNVCTRLVATLRQPLPTAAAIKWLNMAVAQKTDFFDSHPALRERMAALGYRDLLENERALASMLPGDITLSAADELLGKELTRFADVLNRDWAVSMAPMWKVGHEEAQADISRLREIEKLIESGSTLTKEQSWERAKLTGSLHSWPAAKAMLEEMLITYPDSNNAKFALGLALLEEEDESGIQRIREAMNEDKDLVLPGCQILFEYLKERGRDDEAAPFLNCGVEQVEVLEKAEQEIYKVTPGDIFQSCELPPEVVSQITSIVSSDPQIVRSYLVRKIIRNLPDRQCHVLAYIPKFKGLVLNEEEALSKISQRLMDQLHDDHLLLIIPASAANFRFIEAKIKTIPRALIYKKE